MTHVIYLILTAPPAPVGRPYPGDIKPSRHTITIIIPHDLFEEVNGRIAYYAVIVAEGLSKLWNSDVIICLYFWYLYLFINI